MDMPITDRLLRHIADCNNTTLPGGRLRLGGAGVGWIDAATLSLLDPALSAARAVATADGLDIPD
ncbi:hypothetical protein HUK83_07470, partial [Endobacter medicaginis]|nr:hypothetical protein [Endobacter medicaginis]